MDAPDNRQELVKVEQRSFQAGEKVTLDGHVFVDCRFPRCILEYSGGEFLFAGTNNFEAPQWHFLGAADRTVTLLRQLLKTSPDIPAQLFPELFQSMPKNKVQ